MSALDFPHISTLMAPFALYKDKSTKHTHTHTHTQNHGRLEVPVKSLSVPLLVWSNGWMRLQPVILQSRWSGSGPLAAGSVQGDTGCIPPQLQPHYKALRLL